MRLIDADALVAKIWELNKETEESYDLCVDELKDVYSGVVALIDEQPTAYDVDAVIERLKARREAAFHAGNKITLGDVYGLDDAIEIVKTGGSYGK